MKKYIYHLILSIVFIIIYRIGSFSKIPFGDSIGKVLDVEMNKFNLETYSVTHFLYQNFTVLIYKILPLVDPIEIGRWVNIISAVVVLNILFIIIKQNTKNDWVALIGTILFGFSFTFWKNTENIEVYTFSLVWISLYSLYSLKFIKNKSSRTLFVSGIILGGSFLCHVQGILLIPSYLFLCYLIFKKNVNQKHYLLYTLIPFVFLAILYIYPIINNEPIKNVLSSVENSWVSDSLNKGIFDYSKDFIKAIGYIIYNFWGFSLLFFFIPLKTFNKNNFLMFLLIFGLPVFCFSTIYAVSDNYVFFLNFNFSYIIILCIGLTYFIQKFPNFKMVITLLILLTPLYYYSVKEISIQTNIGQEFNQNKSYKGGLDYYLTPWLNNNKGIIELILSNKNINDDIIWMKEPTFKFIQLRSKKSSIDEIKKL